MLTRRAFIGGVAAGAATFSGSSRSLAATHDLVIKGGRVIDPAERLDRIADVAITGGRIAAIQPNVPGDAAETIDARGKLVVPGLIDIHTHTGRSKDLAAFCLSTGVTSCVDAGSAGADGIGDAVAIAKAAPNRIRVLVNLSRTGVTTPGELLDMSRADVALARRAIELNRDMAIGVKVRISRTVAGDQDLEALRRAQAVVSPLNLPLMVHVGQTASPMPAILALLKPGDIVTHVYSPPPNGILDESGKVLAEVREARRRGVLFDVGNGRVGHWTWDSAARAIKEDFLPDTISSDMTDAGRTDQVIDFPNVLSHYLLLGLSLEQVVARATTNAARSIAAFKDMGTLRVGATADVAVLELRAGDVEFVDNEGGKRTGRQRLVTTAAIFGGRPYRAQRG